MRGGDVERAAIALIRKTGGWTRKFTSPGHRGVPDRIFKMRYWPVPIFVEFCATGQIPRADQDHEIQLMAAAGLAVFVVDSIEKFKTVLRVMGEEIDE